MITLGGESVTGVPACFVKLKKYLTNCFRQDGEEHPGQLRRTPCGIRYRRASGDHGLR